jgi:hypothetical protein
MTKHMREANLEKVFPGFSNDPRRYLGMVKA